MSFHYVRFPTDISLGSSGGPERHTEIVVLGSGREERNQRWADSRRRFNAGYGIRTTGDLQRIIEFFEERRGRLFGFLWRDPIDYQSSPPGTSPGPEDQIIGVGDGVGRLFPLVKTYGRDFAPYERRITKPVDGSVRVATGGQERVAGEQVIVDHGDGVVHFNDAFVPEEGAVVTAGFEFDVPVRFDTDRLEIDLVKFDAGLVQDIPIVEIRV